MEKKQEPEHDPRPLSDLSRQQLMARIESLSSQVKQLRTRVAGYEYYKQNTRHFKPRCQEKVEALFQKFKVKKFALLLGYIGIGYNGFAIQSKTDRNTVQYHLFRTLKQLSLLKDPYNCDYTRAARTDAGVSAFGSVVSLNLRSNQLVDQIYLQRNQRCPRYQNMMNALLPNDIRVLGVYQVEKQFNSRYWCLRRSYRYYFTAGHYDLAKMRLAIKKLEGTHDFRNMCKIDLTSAVDFKRTVHKADVEEVGHNQWEDPRMQVCCFYLEANSFLWHQIRYIATLMFLVGSGKAEPSLIDQLLDIQKTTRKPNYPIAPDFPLVLQKCYFPDHTFQVNQATAAGLYESFNQLTKQKLIQLTVFASMNQHLVKSMTSTAAKRLASEAFSLGQLNFKNDKSKFFIKKSSCLTVEQITKKLKGEDLKTYEYKKRKREEYQKKKKEEEEVERVKGKGTD